MTDLRKRKFYTAFVLFAQDGLTHKTLQLHCTHKYLGELDDNAMGAVFRIISKFFEKKQVYPEAVFNERVEFVKTHKPAHEVLKLSLIKDEPIEVVSVLKSFIHKDAFFPELRAELDQFRADDYPDYIPHISIPNYPSVTGQFQCYAIMSGEQIITYWRNPKWEAMERAAKQRELLEKGKKVRSHIRLLKNQRNHRLMD